MQIEPLSSPAFIHLNFTTATISTYHSHSYKEMIVPSILPSFTDTLPVLSDSTSYLSECSINKETTEMMYRNFFEHLFTSKLVIDDEST